MEVVPLSVGVASQRWDDQHLDLDAAAGQVAGAGTGGFTSAVAGAAARFLTQWERHAESLGADSEARADGLRVTIRDYVTSDEAAGADLFLLSTYVAEHR